MRYKLGIYFHWFLIIMGPCQCWSAINLMKTISGQVAYTDPFLIVAQVINTVGLVITLWMLKKGY